MFPAVVAAAFVKQERAVLSLQLRNPGATNIPAVELEVRLDGAVFSFDEDIDDIDVPEAPREWGAPQALGLGPGSYLQLNNLLASPPLRLRGYSSENDGSTVIRYEPVDLRPCGKSLLDPVELLIRVEAGVPIQGAWSATSTGFDGVVEGELTIPTAAAVQVSELLATPEGRT